SCSDQTQHAPCLCAVDRAAGEIIERPVGNADDVVSDKACALAGTVLGVLQAAFPLEHRPAVKPDGSHAGEDRLEVDLPVAERTETAGPTDPGLETRIDTLPAGRIEFRILDVEGADALRIDVDEGEVVQLLQDEMRGIVVDRATRMIAGALVEHFEGDAVADVFTRMNLIAEIDTGLVIGVQDRTPAASQFVEGGLDQSRRPLRPWIEERPGQRAGEADAAAEAYPSPRLRSFQELLHRPDLTFLRSASNRR